MSRGGMSKHEPHYEGKTNTWLTPRWIIDALGPFDLDPCAATVRPFDCAAENYVEAQNGLALPWHGRVWCNPPYGPHVGKWLGKCADHGDAIALVFARTETNQMQAAIRRCRTMVFPLGRIKFLRPDGTPGEFTSGAPSMFLAFGEQAAMHLRLVNQDLHWGIEAPPFRVADQTGRLA